MWPFDRSVRLARVRIVRIDIRARRRAIHGDPTLSNRMFVLIEQRNMISSGSNVPSSPRKKEIDRLRRDRSISRSRRSSSHQPASDVAQSTVRAPRATRQDREWRSAYLSCNRQTKEKQPSDGNASSQRSRSDLQTNSPGDTRDLQNSGFAKQTTKTNTIQQSTSVGAVLGL